MCTAHCAVAIAIAIAGVFVVVAVVEGIRRANKYTTKIFSAQIQFHGQPHMLSHFSLWCSAQWKWFSGERQPISENRKKNFSLFTSFSVISCVSWCALCWYSSSSVQKVFYVCAQCSMFTDVLLCERKKIGYEHKQNNRCRSAAAVCENRKMGN